jgi:hypothetical protein
MKPECIILIPNQCCNRRTGARRHPQERGNWRLCHQQAKPMAKGFWNEKGEFLVSGDRCCLFEIKISKSHQIVNQKMHTIRYSYDNVVIRQLLHVSAPTGPSGSAQLHITIVDTFYHLQCEVALLWIRQCVIYSRWICAQLLGRVFGPRRDEVTGEWRKLHNEELNDLYSLPNIVRVINSRRMRWAGHVARMGTGDVCTAFWWGSLWEGDHWGDPDIDGRIILRWILRTWDVGGYGLDRTGSG